MRDPVIFRIDYTSHFRQGDKYCVWPLYDFQAVVEDQLCEITHILRSSEFGEMRIELQDRIKDMLGFGKQTYVQYGRFEVAGFVTQGREIREMIESGKISGWDDPRLVTLKALKKRGIVRETYYNLAKRLGLNPTSAKMEWHMIASENRKVIDQLSKRYFFVSDPVEIMLDKVSEKSVEAPLLPGKDEFRRIPVTEKIYVDKADFEANKGKEVRLMHFCNVILDKKAKVAGKDLDVPKIHWVPSENFGMKMVMPDATEVYGLAEPEVQDVEPNQIVQFERMGFARCEKKGLFYFAHK
jgi:glutamyl-tRNA synthetase